MCPTNWSATELGVVDIATKVGGLVGPPHHVDVIITLKELWIALGDLLNTKGHSRVNQWDRWSYAYITEAVPPKKNAVVPASVHISKSSLTAEGNHGK